MDWFGVVVFGIVVALMFAPAAIRRFGEWLDRNV